MATKIKGHKVKKDGTLETMGDVHDRLSRRFNMKAIGAAVMGVGAVAAFLDAATANNPVLQKVIVEFVNDNVSSDQIARIVEMGASFAATIGAVWAATSAIRDSIKIDSVSGHMSSLGRNYRPGDRKRQEAELAAKAAINREVA